MTGEYLVAAQLHRLNILGTITYGNSKKADVIAFSERTNFYISIEVKSSSKGKWHIGNCVPEPSDKLWIFVHIPYKIEDAPEFFVMTQEDIHRELKDSENQYLERYRLKHGNEYGNKPGFASMKIEIARKYCNQWSKIISRLNEN